MCSFVLFVRKAGWLFFLATLYDFTRGAKEAKAQSRCVCMNALDIGDPLGKNKVAGIVFIINTVKTITYERINDERTGFGDHGGRGGTGNSA
jgi:hypothetical protein